jgi:hypothetical protein
MQQAGLWRSRKQKIESITNGSRHSSRGELGQCYTSKPDWLEGRGEKLYLIHRIDDATSELTARFVQHDSTEEEMRSYLEQHGRPVVFYIDKASLFRTATPLSSVPKPTLQLNQKIAPCSFRSGFALSNRCQIGWHRRSSEPRWIFCTTLVIYASTGRTHRLLVLKLSTFCELRLGTHA